MKATVWLLRWPGIGVTLWRGVKSSAPRHGLIRWLLLVRMIGGVTFGAQAQHQFGIEDNPDETLTIFGGQSCPGGDLIIPDVLDGRKVTGIRQSAFYSCIGLISVTIGHGVTRIGSGAFSDCIALTSVTIGNGVTNMEAGTFSGCLGLTSVVIGNSVTSIGPGAFSGCSSLDLKQAR